jgi:hypothetical protein
MARISRVSLEYLATTVRSDTEPGGTPQFAFTQGEREQPSTWYDGAWEDAAEQRPDDTWRREAFTPLIGPGGAVQLAPGRWRVWLRYADSPEIPAERLDDQLVVY